MAQKYNRNNIYIERIITQTINNWKICVKSIQDDLMYTEHSGKVNYIQNAYNINIRYIIKNNT